MKSNRRPPSDLERAGIIHDANQLLAVIAGRAGLMLRREEAGDRRRQLAAIEQAARDAAALLARLDPHADPERTEPPTRLLEAAGLSAQLVLPDPETACTLEISADAWTDVPGLVVRETLNNLLVNALEAAGDAVRVRITHRREVADHVLEIADDGPGIAAEVAGRIFDGQASTKAEAGRGVGLPACRQRLRDHGADLQLASAADPGAVFVLRLPAVHAPTSAAAGEGPTPAAEAGRILVVDDDEAVREMLHDVFVELGAEVTALRDPLAARQRFAAGEYDLVVLDQGLPGLSGRELARELRMKDPAVAIALVSGWGRQEQLDAADPDHVDFTASKPLDWNRMRDLLFEGTRLCRRRRGP